MAKRNIEVVKITLDVDLEQEIRDASKSISEDTRNAIDTVIAETKQKQEEKDQKKAKKESKQKDIDDKLEVCLQKLLGASKDSPISSDEIKQIMEMDSLSGIMLRVRKAVKEKSLSVCKRTIKKVTHYWIEQNG